METQLKSRTNANNLIVIHKRWTHSRIISNLKAVFTDVSTQDLGHYDFHLSTGKYVIYVTESDLISNIKLDKFFKINKEDTIVIAIRNMITAEQYSHLQDLLVVKNDYQLIPVGEDAEVPNLLLQLSCTNATITPKKSQKLEGSLTNQYNLLMNIPSLGKTKTEKLLETYGTINKIASMPFTSLSSKLGVQFATEIYKFFNDNSSF